MRRYFHILLFIFPFHVSGQQIRISVFNNIPVKTLVTSCTSGKYFLFSDNQKIAGSEGKIFYITLYNKKLLLHSERGPVGSYDELVLTPGSDSAKVLMTPVEPKTPGRTYTGNIRLKIEYGRILMLNETDVERYIAGVVEAESGIRALPEFYKTQALLSRTYLYGHLNRHASEGFNLCDEVHCQVYRGITPFTGFIGQSTVLTKNKVIYSSDSTLITATFHANCGGETETPLNTWLKAESYLVPVKDPYCKSSPNSSWEKKIPLPEWKKYLSKKGINSQTLPVSSLEMKKPGRQIWYKVGKSSVLTTQIRADWNLKSSFFQVFIKNNDVILKGHGYGHGVGLCQNGAMKMAVLGKSYREIIDFYFKNVKVRDFKS